MGNLLTKLRGTPDQAKQNQPSVDLAAAKLPKNNREEDDVFAKSSSDSSTSSLSKEGDHSMGVEDTIEENDQAEVKLSLGDASVDSQQATTVSLGSLPTHSADGEITHQEANIPIQANVTDDEPEVPPIEKPDVTDVTSTGKENLNAAETDTSSAQEQQNDTHMSEKSLESNDFKEQAVVDDKIENNKDYLSIEDSEVEYQISEKENQLVEDAQLSTNSNLSEANSSTESSALLGVKEEEPDQPIFSEPDVPDDSSKLTIEKSSLLQGEKSNDTEPEPILSAPNVSEDSQISNSEGSRRESVTESKTRQTDDQKIGDASVPVPPSDICFDEVCEPKETASNLEITEDEALNIAPSTSDIDIEENISDETLKVFENVQEKEVIIRDTNLKSDIVEIETSKEDEVVNEDGLFGNEKIDDGIVALKDEDIQIENETQGSRNAIVNSTNNINDVVEKSEETNQKSIDSVDLAITSSESTIMVDKFQPKIVGEEEPKSSCQSSEQELLHDANVQEENQRADSPPKPENVKHLGEELNQNVENENSNIEHGPSPSDISTSNLQDANGCEFPSTDDKPDTRKSSLVGSVSSVSSSDDNQQPLEDTAAKSNEAIDPISNNFEEVSSQTSTKQEDNDFTDSRKLPSTDPGHQEAAETQQSTPDSELVQPPSVQLEENSESKSSDPEQDVDVTVENDNILRDDEPSSADETTTAVDERKSNNEINEIDNDDCTNVTTESQNTAQKENDGLDTEDTKVTSEVVKSEIVATPASTEVPTMPKKEPAPPAAEEPPKAEEPAASAEEPAAGDAGGDAGNDAE